MIKFLVRIYRVVADYFLHRSGSKVKWGNKTGPGESDLSDPGPEKGD